MYTGYRNKLQQLKTANLLSSEKLECSEYGTSSRLIRPRVTVLMAARLSPGLAPVWWVQPVGRIPSTWSYWAGSAANSRSSSAQLILARSRSSF